MEFKILASGSKGNVTTIHTGDSLLLIDCGKPFRWTIKQLNQKLPDAILITHEHGDHAKSAKNFLERGVEMYMTAGTAEVLGLKRHNLHIIEAGIKFDVAGVEVKPIESFHDAAEPINFILEDEHDRVLFMTDTGLTPQVHGDFTKIFIEANYSAPCLINSDTPYRLKKRINDFHYSIEQAEKFIKKYPRAEVTLIHISEVNGNREEFHERIRRVQSWALEQN